MNEGVSLAINDDSVGSDNKETTWFGVVYPFLETIYLIVIYPSKKLNEEDQEKMRMFMIRFGEAAIGVSFGIIQINYVSNIITGHIFFGFGFFSIFYVHLSTLFTKNWGKKE